jgi:hypothetical protein
MNDAELDRILDAWSAPAVPASLRARLQSALPEKRARRTLGRPRWIAAFAAAGALAAAASIVSNGILQSDAGPWDSHTYVRRTRIVQPPIAKLKWQSGKGGSSGWQWKAGELVGSMSLDAHWSHARYGYRWTARPLASSAYLFTVHPLQPSAVSPAPRVVRPGDAFDVDLYASGSERVYDRYELFGQPVKLVVPDELRGPDVLTLTTPRLFINGLFATGPGGVVEAKCEVMYVELPGRGRYLFALAPYANFQVAGHVTGNMLEFQSGGDRFRIESSAQIASGGTRSLFLLVQRGVQVQRPNFGAGRPAER